MKNRGFGAFFALWHFSGIFGSQNWHWARSKNWQHCFCGPSITIIRERGLRGVEERGPQRLSHYVYSLFTPKPSSPAWAGVDPGSNSHQIWKRQCYHWATASGLEVWVTYPCPTPLPICVEVFEWWGLFPLQLLLGRESKLKGNWRNHGGLTTMGS